MTSTRPVSALLFIFLQAWIVKLNASIVNTGDPLARQRAVRGTTIAFPQDNAIVDAVEFPRSLASLAVNRPHVRTHV